MESTNLGRRELRKGVVEMGRIIRPIRVAEEEALGGAECKSMTQGRNTSSWSPESFLRRV